MNGPSSQWLRFRLALSFLTRLPTGRIQGGSDEDFGKSFVYLPAVGLLIGSIMAFTAGVLSFFFPYAVLGPFLLGIQIYITGGIHLDGFMDTFDGIFSNRKPERILEIMRDSRVGAHAVLSVIVLLMLKVGAFISLTYPSPPSFLVVASWNVVQGFYGNENLNPLLLTLFWIPVVGRWANVLAAYKFPYIRPEGLGSLFQKYIDHRLLWGATLFTIIAAGFAAGLIGFVVLSVIWLFVVRWGTYLTKLLGGLTGDIYGATCEIAEVFGLLVIVAFWHHSFNGMMLF